MPSSEIDYKRYKIIILLYLIFICFSVLNIKISTLDSNYYTIKTFQQIQLEVSKKIELHNLIINNNKDTLNQIEQSKNYMQTSARIDKSLNVLNGIINHINFELKKNKLDFVKQFNSRVFIEKTLKDSFGVNLLERDLFDLQKFLYLSKYPIPNFLDNLIPLKSEITNLKGRKNNWQSYLFFHKPLAISYMQLERIKLLLMQTNLQYKEATINLLGYKSTYISNTNNKIYTNDFQFNDSLFKYHDKNNQNHTLDSILISDNVLKNIIKSLHTENIFVGFKNVLFNDFNQILGKNFDFEITPNVSLLNNGKDILAIFNKSGQYVLRFYDLRNGRHMLFEKNINVTKIPDPIVRIKGDILNNFTINMKDLITYERLEAKVDINDIKYFPGRINSFRLIRFHNGKEEEQIINYGEIFQSTTLKFFGLLKKSDMIIIDNINLTLLDGSTRMPSPIIYRITD